MPYLAACLPALAGAQIRTDGSVGPAAQTLAGPNVLIPQNLGRLAGSNLFHSFAEFNIGNGESATFSTSSAGIANVVSRVTGGKLSQINGKLALSAASGNPNLFLINPAGVVFGAGATIDVPGAFHVTTADSLRFADGDFHVDAAKTSHYSAATPQAFGFLGSMRGTVSIRDGAILSARPGQSIQVAAGDVTITERSQLQTTAGDIRIVAFGQASGAIGFAGAVAGASGDMVIDRGGKIVSTVSGDLGAGEIAVFGGNLKIDADGEPYGPTGIGSEAPSGSTGAAADLRVDVAGRVELLGGGRISSTTDGAGDAGSVKVVAPTITIDRQGKNLFTGIASQAKKGSTGNAGSVAVTAELLTVTNDGSINTRTFASGAAGSVKIETGRLVIDGKGFPTWIASDTVGNGKAGEVEIVARQSVELLGGGAISSTTFGAGDAGLVKVAAPMINIDRQGKDLFTGIASTAAKESTGNAGSVAVTAELLTVASRGSINTSTYASGDAGSVKVETGLLVIDGKGFPTWIASDTVGNGKAGEVEVVARQSVELHGGGNISSTTYGAGDARLVKVAAPTITIDGEGKDLFTGITSQAAKGSTGNAGSVAVTAELLTVANRGSMDTNTYASGDAGSVKVETGRLVIDGKGFGARITSDTNGNGKAGDVEIVVRQSVELHGGGVISSTTHGGAGDAGQVKVAAPTITINRQGKNRFTGIASQAAKGSTGNAGSVAVTAELLTVANGGSINTNTFASGDAGSVKVETGRLVIDGKGLGASISSGTFGNGNAGDVEVTATTEMSVRDGGIVTSSTAGSGSAGTVRVRAGTLVVEGGRMTSGIEARAWPGSSGQTGSVTVAASEGLTVANGGALSIENGATVDDPSRVVPTRLAVSAPSIALHSQGRISAAAVGNIAASNLDIRFTDRLTLDSASIATSANRGNGGAIAIRGPGAMVLTQSTVTTSVAGQSGNGGNISISAGGLAMNTGFIQANTAAANASGGDVAIDVRLLVPSGNSLIVGGSTPYEFRPEVFGLNVIQAAAPTGLSGTVLITTPAIDVSGSLGGLKAQTIDAGGLGRNPCRNSDGSSLAQTGRGGLPPSNRETLTVDAATSGPVATRTPPEPLLLVQAGAGCRQ